MVGRFVIFRLVSQLFYVFFCFFLVLTSIIRTFVNEKTLA